MIINKIGLKNFRQFYKDQEVGLSTDTQKNVTLIHAENGFGKTTLLNAVLWTFFQQTTTKFEKPNEIVNYEALRERDSLSRVSVEFNHEGRRYLAERTYDEEKSSYNKTDFAIFSIGESGHHRKINSPETFIKTVIPSEMAKYFFFDGEAAETFTTARNFKAISEAIKNILGSTLAKAAIQDLKDIEKTIGKSLMQIPGQEKLASIEREILQMEEKIESFNIKKSESEEERDLFNSTLNDINEKLRNSAGAKEIQQRRDEKERLLTRTKNEINEINQEIINWIGKRGIAVVSRRLTQTSLDFIDEESLKGKIPSPYNREFVEGLLKSEECICHRPLLPETEEWRAVNSLLSDAPDAQAQRRVMSAKGQISQLRKELNEAPQELKKLRLRLADRISFRDQLEHEIGELGLKLEEIDIAEINELEQARRKAQQRIQELSQGIGNLQMVIGSYQKRKKELEQERLTVAGQNKKANQLLLRQQLLERSGEFITGLLKNYEDEAKETLEVEINQILEEVAHRPYKCRIESNFAIDLIFPDGRSVPRSGGENQLLSLLFIGSLVKFAASRIDDNKFILKPGTIAPLILDAPFGQLDPYYQKDVASYIPKLAHQVVLLVSSSQGNEGVLRALEPFIGAEYVLFSENKEPRGNKKETKLYLHGEEYVTSLFNQPRTMTRIEKIL